VSGCKEGNAIIRQRLRFYIDPWWWRWKYGGGGGCARGAFERSGGTTTNPTTNPPKMYFCLRLVRLFLISAILCVGKARFRSDEMKFEKLARRRRRAAFGCRSNQYFLASEKAKKVACDDEMRRRASF